MERYQKLKEMLCAYPRIAIAYSGGVDSLLLLRAACDAIGCENVLAITVYGALHTEDEIEYAKKTACELCVSHKVIYLDFLSVPEVKSNSPLRCYYCKKCIFEEIIRIASSEGIDTVCDGTNASDNGAYRPGMCAIAELSISSPLRDSGITKQDARELLSLLGIEARPSNSCLATRIPYNTPLEADVLNKISMAEARMNKAGFPICRVRVHGDVARIEIPKDDFLRFLSMTELHDDIKRIGFTFVSLDLEGYRSGCFDTKEGSV